jgi:hypothetical protein
MSSSTRPLRILYQNLDTSFVNLWHLLRYLSQRKFIGRVHVELKNYSADVFLDGSQTPLVHEVDRESGNDVVEEAALHRLVLRARESTGTISVFEGENEARGPQFNKTGNEAEDAADEETVPAISEPRLPADPIAATPAAMRSASATTAGAANLASSENSPAAEEEWSEALRASGELIAGVEHAAASAGADFVSLFRESQIKLADDYPFLDPMSGQFQYEKSTASVNGAVPVQNYVTGISEALRGVVDQLATGERARRTRERVALELARVARKNNEAMSRSGFKSQLDRIAGAKVV